MIVQYYNVCFVRRKFTGYIILLVTQNTMVKPWFKGRIMVFWVSRSIV